MADERQLKQAQAVYKSLRETFDSHGFQYEADDEKLTVYSGAKGDDLPVDIIMRVDAERMLVIANSQMPFEVPENRRLQMAIAVSRANYGLPDGNFDYDYLTGDIVFRLTCCYRDSLIGSELFEYMLVVTFGIVDDYNHLLEKAAYTDMSVEEIMNIIK